MNTVSDLNLSLPPALHFNGDVDRDVNWDDFSSSIMLEVIRDKHIYTCSAVAITKNVLLTAAHCVEGGTSGKALLDTTYNPKNNQNKPNSINFKKVIIHSGYDPKRSNFKDDIALIILEHNLPSNRNVATIDWEINLNEIISLDRIGFGGRDNVNTRTWTNPKNLHLFSNTSITLSDRYAVVGDSGGPIYGRTANGLKLLGIHSTLEGKDKTYSSFVVSYKKWIEKNLPIKEI